VQALIDNLIERGAPSPRLWPLILAALLQALRDAKSAQTGD
jgi:hypothetical protein